MAVEDLGPAERFTAGALGEPGRRRFYFAVRAGGRALTFLAEKTQVEALAVQGTEILDRRGIVADDVAVDALVAGGVGIDPDEGEERFRVGEIAMSIAPSELMTLVLTSVEEDEAVTFVIAPEQFRAMAEVALRVVAAGRPPCPWCGLPIDPDGHECPARN